MMIAPRKIKIGTNALMSIAISSDVTVVPIFAPKSTPIAWPSSIRPAFAKPTTIASVADELWITAVTSVPTSIAKNLLLVIFCSRVLSLLPAASSRPSPMFFIPMRNSPRPPRAIITFNKIL